MEDHKHSIPKLAQFNPCCNNIRSQLLGYRDSDILVIQGLSKWLGFTYYFMPCREIKLVTEHLPSFSFPTIRTGTGNSSKPLARLHLLIRSLLALLQMHLCELVRTNSTYRCVSNSSNCYSYRSYRGLLDLYSILSLLLT